MSPVAGYPRRRFAVLMPLTLLTAAVVLSACASGTSAPTAAGSSGDQVRAAPPATKPGGGVAAVATVSGDGGAPQDTAPFTVRGGNVRIVFTVQPNDVGPVPFKWSMFDNGTPVNAASPRASNGCVSCDGRQTHDLGAVPAGTYHLHILTSRPFTLTVVEGS